MVKFKEIYLDPRSIPEPTEKQIKSGKYPKRLIKWHGLKIRIENEEGTIRRGIGPDGIPWETEFKYPYGYIEGFKGLDKDELDVFVGPLINFPPANKVYIVNQVKDDGSPDEEKIIIGVDSKDSAKKVYLSNYEIGWKNYRKIEEMSIREFLLWIHNKNNRS